MKFRKIVCILLLTCIAVPLFAFNTSTYSLCDVNADGKINSIDAVIMSQLYSGTYSLSSGTKRADLNADGKINAIDLSILSLYIVGKYDINDEVSGGYYPVGAGTEKYKSYLENRVGDVEEDVVLGIGDNALYGVDFDGMENDGFIIRSSGAEVLLFGKTADGLYSATRVFAAQKEEGSAPASVTYKGTGDRFSDPFTFWLDWGSRRYNIEQIKRPDGSLPQWDWIEAEKRGIEYVHPFTLSYDENGNTISWQPNTVSLKNTVEKMRGEIEKSHETGIKVLAYSANIQYQMPQAEIMGYTHEQIAAVKNGDYAYTDIYDTYLACLNSSEWRSWVRTNIKSYAEAGFDGVMYDYSGPYSGTSVYCECERCARSWGEYSAEKMGVAQKLPTAGVILSAEADKWYCRWKVEMILDFYEDTLSEAKKVNPDFAFIINDDVLNNMFTTIAMSDLCTIPSSELWGTIIVGRTSSLFMYQIGEALGHDHLIGVINMYSQVETNARYKIALSESFAANGTISYADYPFFRNFYGFMKLYPELFQTSDPVSNVAVLYSTDSDLCSGNGSSGPINAGQFLASHGALYDYLVIDRADSLEKLDNYDVYIVPNYRLIGDEWNPYLDKILSSGKEVIVVGSYAKRVVNKKAVTNGTKVNYVAYLTDVTTLKDTKAYDVLRSEKAISGESGIEFTARRPQDNYDVIHAVRMGDYLDKAAEPTELCYKIPSGKTVAYVSAYCPYASESTQYHVDCDWNVSNGAVNITLGEFDTHCIIQIEYTD